jgi:hypothetical protein
VTYALVVPYAAFVASPGCATVLPSVPLSRLDARACRALQYHPQYAALPQRAPRSFLIASVACVALSYATTIYCPYPSTQAAGCIPNTTPTSPAPAVATLQCARRVCRLSDRPGHPQRRPTPPLKPAHGVRVACRACGSRSPSRTPYTSPTHGLRPASHSASMTRTTTSVRSNAAAVLHHPRHFLPVSLRAQHLRRRSALTARLLCSHIPRYSPQHLKVLTTIVKSFDRIPKKSQPYPQ